MARVLLSAKCLLLIAICNSCTKDSLDNGDLYLFFEREIHEYATIIDGEEFSFLPICCPTYTFKKALGELHRDKPDDIDLEKLVGTMGGKWITEGGSGVHPGGESALLSDFYKIPTDEIIGGFSVIKIFDPDGTIRLTYNGNNPLVDSVIFLHPGEEWVVSVIDTVSQDYYDDGQLKTTTAEVTTTYKVVNHGMLKKSDMVIY